MSHQYKQSELFEEISNPFWLGKIDQNLHLTIIDPPKNCNALRPRPFGPR